MIIVAERTKLELFPNKQTTAQEVFRQLDEGGNRKAARLTVKTAWLNEEGAGSAIQVWLRWQDPFGIQEIGGQLPESMAVDQMLPMELGRISLLGFPSST